MDVFKSNEILSISVISIVVNYCFLFCGITTATIHEQVLDKDSDLFRTNWDLEGSLTYFRRGDQLTELQTFLPHDFDYKAFNFTKGIWGIIPKVQKQEVGTSRTTSGSLAYRSSVQIFAFVTVTYFISGDARIYIKEDLDENLIFTIEPSPSKLSGNKWEVTCVPIGLSSRFVVEGVVRGPKSVIFIDRIQGSYNPVTTTTSIAPLMMAAPEIVATFTTTTSMMTAVPTASHTPSHAAVWAMNPTTIIVSSFVLSILNYGAGLS